MTLSRRGADRPREPGHASASTARPITGSPATRSPRRCSPTASTWWAGRSSITARAGLSSAGSEEPNALVIGIPPRRRPVRAEHCAPPVELRRASIADSQNRWPSLAFDLGAVNELASPLFSAGFYYKTFMWPRNPSGTASTSPSSGAPPVLGPRARPSPIPTATHALRPLRRAGRRRRPRRPRRRARPPARTGARVVLVDEHAEAGGTLLSEPRPIDRRQAGLGLARARRSPLAAMPNVTHPDAHHGVRLLPPEHGRPLREGHRPSCPSRANTPRERLWQVRASRGGAGHRRARTTAGLRRQRPARHHAGRCRADLSQPLRREGRRARGDRHHPRQRLCAAFDLRRRRRRRRRPSSTRATVRRRPARRGRARAASRS